MKKRLTEYNLKLERYMPIQRVDDWTCWDYLDYIGNLEETVEVLVKMIKDYQNGTDN